MTTTTIDHRYKSDGINRNWLGTQIAATLTTQAAKPATLTRKKMIIRQIKNDWFRLDTKGLVFFGYSKEHVKHKLEAWVREYDLKKLR